MMIRSFILALALGSLTFGCVADESSAEDPTGTESQETNTSLWKCKNKSGPSVFCSGGLSILPITVNVVNTRVLNDAELKILNIDLTNVSILSQNEVDINKVLSNIEVTVLQDFLNKFKINVTDNDVNVCTAVLAGLLCK
jgi:hypothetical protein